MEHDIHQDQDRRPSRTIQVEASSYARKYMSLQRTITHWHQASAVADHTEAGGSVLEIGPGNGHTTWLLKQFGLNVTTLDYDSNLQPDIVGDITALPCNDGTYDCVLAAEVLEHIPFEEVGKAILELRRVARHNLVITIPAPFVGFSGLINASGVHPRGFHLGLPYWVQHHFDGQHYWELGKQGYSLQLFKRLLRKAGLEIIRCFRPAPSLYSYFFVLRPTN